MPSLPINAIQMHYEHHTNSGSKHCPLLMISGMASDGFTWQPLIRHLTPHIDLLIPDNRCSGRTTPCPVDTSRNHNVADILALLDALEIERVNILGHSMGGMIGWALAEQAPERVNHLISAGAQAWAIPVRIALFKNLSLLRTDENEAQWFELLYQFLFSPAFFEQSVNVSRAAAASMAYPYKQSRAAFTAQAKALETFLTPLNLNAIKCNVSLVTGANDLLMTPALLENFCAEHGYRFAIIPDAAHALHWEQSMALVKYVLNELGMDV